MTTEWIPVDGGYTPSLFDQQLADYLEQLAERGIVDMEPVDPVIAIGLDEFRSPEQRAAFLRKAKEQLANWQRVINVIEGRDPERNKQ